MLVLEARGTAPLVVIVEDGDRGLEVEPYTRWWGAVDYHELHRGTGWTILAISRQ